MTGHWLHVLAMVLVTGYGVALFGIAVYRRLSYVRLGKRTTWDRMTADRLGDFARQTFGQSKLLQDRRSGMMHLVLFYGFVILQAGAVDVMLRGALGRGLPIPGYAAFELLQEVTVALVLLAIGYSAYRRFGEKLPRLDRRRKAGAVVWFITLLMGSVLLTLALDVLRAGTAAPQFALFAPISTSLAVIAHAGGIGPGSTAAHAAFFAAWWAHLLILLAFLVYVPQSKHFHLLTAPLNLLLRRSGPPGKLEKLDLEDEAAETFGVGAIEQFREKQLLDLYACVECGRCTNVCPASGTGKLLSPMHLMVKLRDHLTEKGAAITSRSPWVPAYAFGSANMGSHRMKRLESIAGDGLNGTTDIAPTMAAQQKSWVREEGDPRSVQLVGEVMTEEELWSCTTCRNCEEVCPVGNEHVDKIVDMRRYLTLTEGSIPAEAQRAMQNIERQGNPWGISRSDRVKWTQEAERQYGLKVPTVKENPAFDYLLLVGSMGAYDTRSRSIVVSLVRLLAAAGVSFAILGNEERSSGDTARRLGNEMLFQQLCEANIRSFIQYDVRRIVTCCPHTFNVIKNEYPDFGLPAEIEVLHHSQLLVRLLKEKKLTPIYELRERVAFHDSCYLGRYNGVYGDPRELLAAIPGLELAELERSRSNGMCCGAGGGMMWMEEHAGKRMNVARVEQALAVQPTVIGSSCPYCLTMMRDGIKLKEAEDGVRAHDIAELLAGSVFGWGKESTAGVEGSI